MSLSVESGVIRAINQYILPCVERIAHGFLNNLIPSAVVLSSAVEVTVGDLRYCYAWYATYQGFKKLVLLLEYKGPGALVAAQWPTTAWTQYGWRSYQTNPIRASNADAMDVYNKVTGVKRLAESRNLEVF